MKEKLRFVQVDFSAYLSSGEFIAMQPEQRGVFMTLIMFLYANGGSVPFKPAILSRVCNCDDEAQFEQSWNNMKHLFRRRGRQLAHPTVTEDLQRAREYKKKKSEAGRKGMASRWAKDNADITKEKEVREREGKSTSYSELGGQRPFLFSFGSESPDARVYELYDRLQAVVAPVTRSDRTSLRNVARWAVERITTGAATIELARILLGIASDVATARNPRSAFMAMVKKELQYSPKKKARSS